MFNTNPKVQEIHRQLREAQDDLDYNEIQIEEARNYGGDLKRLFTRKDRLRAAIQKLEYRLNSLA